MKANSRIFIFFFEVLWMHTGICRCRVVTRPSRIRPIRTIHLPAALTRPNRPIQPTLPVFIEWRIVFILKLYGFVSEFVVVARGSVDATPAYPPYNPGRNPYTATPVYNPAANTPAYPPAVSPPYGAFSPAENNAGRTGGIGTITDEHIRASLLSGTILCLFIHQSVKLARMICFLPFFHSRCGGKTGTSTERNRRTGSGMEYFYNCRTDSGSDWLIEWLIAIWSWFDSLISWFDSLISWFRPWNFHTNLIVFHSHVFLKVFSLDFRMK